MARRPFFREGPAAPQRTRINHMIRITPVRLIDAANEQAGVVETHEALRMAQEQGLDLVEIVPDSRPPVCKIMDYGKFKYEQSQKDRKQRAASKATEMKEVRLGRSVKIDDHDVKIRNDQARRFLMAGHKVLVTQRFKGREITHKELGLQRLAKFYEALSDISKVEQTPKWFQKQASIILAPDKVKVEAVKRKLEKEKAALGRSEAQARAEVEAETMAAAAEAEKQTPEPDDADGDDE